jgi:hypothetical protein
MTRFQIERKEDGPGRAAPEPCVGVFAISNFTTMPHSPLWDHIVTLSKQLFDLDVEVFECPVPDNVLATVPPGASPCLVVRLDFTNIDPSREPALKRVLAPILATTADTYIKAHQSVHPHPERT